MIIISIIGLVSLLVLNIWFGMYYGFGFRHYWFFEFLHFLGGFFVAIFLANFTSSAIFIFSGLAVISFLWELMEYAISRIPKWSNFMKQAFHIKNFSPSWEDTVLDIFLNFLGTLAFIALKTIF